MGEFLKNRLKSTGDLYLYTPEFKTFIETHLNYIRSNEITEIKVLTDEEINKNLYNFYGYLNSLNIKMEDWWIHLRVNNMSHPFDFNFTSKVIYIAPTKLLENLKQYYRQIEK